MTDATVRPDWRTLGRRSGVTTAYPARPGPCGVCDEQVGVHEPIVADPLRRPAVQEPDGRRHVDVSGVVWAHQRCVPST